jgi:hypothetical protein
MSSYERGRDDQAAWDVGPRMSVLHDAAPIADAVGPGMAADAMRACTLTLVALLAWMITPPAAVLLFATVGLVGVARAHFAGKVEGHCSLRRPWLVGAYLCVAWVLGAWFTVAEVAALMS